MDGKRWKLLWSGRLHKRTSVIDLDNPVRLPALGARGFLLYNPERHVRMSAPNTGQVKIPIPPLVNSVQTCITSQALAVHVFSAAYHNSTTAPSDRLPPNAFPVPRRWTCAERKDGRAHGLHVPQPAKVWNNKDLRARSSSDEGLGRCRKTGSWLSDPGSVWHGLI